jgi:hypothetical protein
LAQIARWLLIFVTRYSLVVDLDPAEMENVFFKLARETRERMKSPNAAAGCMSHIKASLIGLLPNDTTVSMASRSLIVSSEAAHYMLNRIARRMQTDTKEIQLDESNVEHIFPQNPDESAWGGEENQQKLEPFTWHIGNLTMLGERMNKKAANKDYIPTKRDIYAKSTELEMAKKIAADYPDHWDAGTICDRAAKLAPLIVEIWNFNNPSWV